MIVYADILIILNFIVDYFLLMLTAQLLRRPVTLARQMLAAGVGALSSMLIFLPKLHTAIQLFFCIAVALVMTAVAFGIECRKRFLRAAAILFAVSFGYAGGMLALWFIFKPNGMVIHNSIVYFNISPLFLIVFSVAVFFIVALLRKLLDRTAPLAESCEISLFVDNKSITVTAIADTGNSIEDVFGLSEVIIADRAAATALLGDYTEDPQMLRRYRALPCNTVSGSELLDGYRCDKAYITHNGKTLEIRKPILAVSKSPLGGDYSAIINPKILL